MLVDLSSDIMLWVVYTISNSPYNLFLRNEKRSWCIAEEFLRKYFTNTRLEGIDVFIKSDRECRSMCPTEDPFLAPLNLVEVIEATPLERVKKFDFTHSIAAVGMTKDGGWWGKCHERFEKDCREKRLVVNEEWNGVGSVRRLRKFLDQGWVIKDEELGKLMRELILNQRGEEEETPVNYAPPPPEGRNRFATESTTVPTIPQRRFRWAPTAEAYTSNSIPSPTNIPLDPYEVISQSAVLNSPRQGRGQ